MESDGLGLYFSLLDINLISGEDDGDVLADTDQVTCRLDVSLLELLRRWVCDC